MSRNCNLNEQNVSSTEEFGPAGVQETRTPFYRPAADPSAHRAGPSRLPPGLHPAQDPATLRRTALPSKQAPERTVTATLAMPLDGAT